MPIIWGELDEDTRRQTPQGLPHLLLIPRGPGEGLQQIQYPAQLLLMGSWELPQHGTEQGEQHCLLVRDWDICCEAIPLVHPDRWL